MAAQPAPLNLEAFHQKYSGAKPAYEYWRGVAIQKSIPTILHGIVQMILSMLLENAGWNTASEVRLKIVSDAEPVPDLIATRGKFKGHYPTIAPPLCIEILSPSDTLARTLDKAQTYVSWGSQCVWIIDPEKRTAWSASQHSEPVWICPGGSLRIDETAISLSTLFSHVDRKLESVEEL